MDLIRLEQKRKQNELEMARLQEQIRKLDTQMKIIIGACVINQCKKDQNFLRTIEQVIDANASDRDKKRIAGFSDWIQKQASDQTK